MLTYEVCIDWNCADWAGVHDFTGEYDNISAYVKPGFPKITGNAKRDDFVYPARSCELQLENSSGIFFNNNEGSPLHNLIRPWLPVRVRAILNDTPYPRFYGYINRLRYYPIKDKQTAYLYATDGSDLLAKTIVVQDLDDKIIKTDGEAVDDILTAGGWAATRRVIDLDGGDIVNFPDTFAYTKS